MNKDFIYTGVPNYDIQWNTDKHRCSHFLYYHHLTMAENSSHWTRESYRFFYVDALGLG